MRSLLVCFRGSGLLILGLPRRARRRNPGLESGQPLGIADSTVFFFFLVVIVVIIFIILFFLVLLVILLVIFLLLVILFTPVDLAIVFRRTIFFVIVIVVLASGLGELLVADIQRRAPCNGNVCAFITCLWLSTQEVRRQRRIISGRWRSFLLRLTAQEVWRKRRVILGRRRHLLRSVIGLALRSQESGT